MTTPQLVIQQLTKDTDELVELLQDAHRREAAQKVIIAEQQTLIKDLKLLSLMSLMVIIVGSGVLAFILW